MNVKGSYWAGLKFKIKKRYCCKSERVWTGMEQRVDEYSTNQSKWAAAAKYSFFTLKSQFNPNLVTEKVKSWNPWWGNEASGGILVDLDCLKVLDPVSTLLFNQSALHLSQIQTCCWTPTDSGQKKALLNSLWWRNSHVVKPVMSFRENPGQRLLKMGWTVPR